MEVTNFTTKGLLINPQQYHRKFATGERGDLNSLTDIKYEIATLPLVTRNDDKRGFVKHFTKVSVLKIPRFELPGIQ